MGRAWGRPLQTLFVFACGAMLGAGCMAGSTDRSGATEAALSGSLSELETNGSWQTCSTGSNNCGGAGGNGTPVSTSFNKGSYGGRSNAASIAIGGGVSYGTAYWWEDNAPLSYQIVNLDVYTDFYIPSGTQWQAIEWDPQQVRSMQVYNFGLQANNQQGAWFMFDYAAGQWAPLGIAMHVSEGAWHNLHAHYHTAGGYITLDWLEVDGVRSAPTQNATQQSVTRSDYTTDGLSMGLQLDQVSSGASYSAYYDHVNMAFDDGAAAPTILEPTAGQSVGPAIDLRVAAPPAIVAINCYLDGNGTPVASANGDSLTQWVSVAMGSHTIQCNGWDAVGAVYSSPFVPFTRTY